jgi:Undecaprenyl-phosphate galactose phosphotransferase WbaP
MPAMLACSDIVAVFSSSTICILTRYALGGQFELTAYFKLWPLLFCFIISYAVTGAYSFLMAAPIELKRCLQASAFMFLFLAAITFWSRTAEAYSRTILFFACLLTIMIVPVFRRTCRRLLSNFEQWRLPAIVYGSGEVAQSMIKNLNEHLCLGLRPVALIGDSPLCDDKTCFGVRRFSSEAIQELAAEYPQAYFIIADPSLTLKQYQDILRESNRFFSKTVIAPDIFRQASMWASVVDINGILGLETGQKLLSPWPRFYKRAMDIACAFFGILLLSPVLLLLSIIIVVDSPSSVFFFQERIGRGGKRFKMWKFRTMVKNADEVLARHLEENPSLKKEWQGKQKLSYDPRITRIGNFLRKSSLDELPQLINVLKGDMSLVGPRPIVDSEIRRYSETFELYKKVYPGMTGLWQVSGRSGLKYDERVQLDVYYVRNWSIWFDLYILSRTPAAVLKCNGAC